jgi:hypothetical protein
VLFSSKRLDRRTPDAFYVELLDAEFDVDPNPPHPARRTCRCLRENDETARNRSDIGVVWTPQEVYRDPLRSRSYVSDH